MSAATRSPKAVAPRTRTRTPTHTRPPLTDSTVGAQLRDIENEGGNGTLHFPSGLTLDVTNLTKPYFGDAGITKGDVMGYYTYVAPVLLPLMADRPLVLKRFPDGIDGNPFYQQNAPNDAPDCVRVGLLRGDKGMSRRIVGGDLPTLLYTVQLGAIEVHPWLSRMKTPAAADYTVLDLDPTPTASFGHVIRVAQWIQVLLHEAKIRGAIKTSGSRGLHIFIPMPPRTGYGAAQEFAQTIAAEIAMRYPKDATIQRSIAKRPPGTVYVDYLQNSEGKSVAAPFSVRAKAGAPVSMPIEWKELTPTLRMADFTMESAMRMAKARSQTWEKCLTRVP